jgi:diacylglycerol kinase family enzyme
VQVPGEDDVEGVFLAIIQNASPWTYLGTLPVNPLPDVDWDNGLGIWAVRRMKLFDGLRYSRRILMQSKAGSTKSLYVGTDLETFRVIAEPPISLQIDGEGLGQISDATFTSHPDMLRVYT